MKARARQSFVCVICKLKTLDIPAVAEVMIDQDDLVVLLTQDDRSGLLVVQLP
ncbi:hypothetical protein U27_05361 [Candidatus Vecturithrix granuli]|uniref:Uncharacterized protein n=1 Tax=Vecturithrix granuli TaxID=1499967 RepID=A0A081C1D2_VECG1|nr:hypothetical protein U27_05361 [Candidatus Vecturithrix granuli]